VNASTLQPQQLDRVLAVVREGVGAGQAPCAVLAIASADQVIRCDAVPSQDGREQPDADAIFLLASITKPFMGAAILQLAEQGRLLLSDPVTRYIPEFACYGKGGVTIWHLLTHTSGMAGEAMQPVLVARGSGAAHLDAAVHTTLHFAPGTAFQYCNISFWIMGEVIRLVTGEAYPEYIQRHILEPLGMHSTGFGFQGPQADRMMPVHVTDPNDALTSDLGYFRSLALPAGGLWSTAHDLVTFGQALLRGVLGRGHSILSQAALKSMTRKHTEGLRDYAGGQPVSYGLCCFKPPVSTQTLGTCAGFGHGGATGTLLWIEPDYELVLVFLTNVWGLGDRVGYLALNASLAAL
jgi:CubicO group peptidase (beta-lactamase class C family)